MRTTPMDAWISGLVLPTAGRTLTPRLLEQYQLAKLQEVVARVAQKSPFYRRQFAGLDDVDQMDLAAFSRLPFTTAADIREQGMRLLCTSQDEIERVVTLQTSGTTGDSKRIFFTASDLELTVDFFRHGMQTMVSAGATVIIFLPGELPGSVGDLLSRALASIGVKPVVHGPVRDATAARAEILRHESPCLVGIPTQMLNLARGAGGDAIPEGWVSSVLLSTDYVPKAIESEIERLWSCRVFTHYGLTETGLGGGVECEARDGYHLREADLYTEIIDPLTGRRLEDGAEGEVVFTTLTRQGMPLVRYRTGDLARIITEPCPCGSVLKRLGRVRGRRDSEVVLAGGARLTMAALDEGLFSIDGVLNFTAEVVDSSGQNSLNLTFKVVGGTEERVARKALNALLRGDTLGPLFRDKILTVGSITFGEAEWFTNGTGKRQIRDKRHQHSNQ